MTLPELNEYLQSDTFAELMVNDELLFAASIPNAPKKMVDFLFANREKYPSLYIGLEAQENGLTYVLKLKGLAKLDVYIDYEPEHKDDSVQENKDFFEKPFPKEWLEKYNASFLIIQFGSLAYEPFRYEHLMQKTFVENAVYTSSFFNQPDKNLTPLDYFAEYLKTTKYGLHDDFNTPLVFVKLESKNKEEA